MNKFKVFYDDQPDDGVNRLSSIIEKVGIQVIRLDGGDGFGLGVAERNRDPIAALGHIHGEKERLVAGHKAVVERIRPATLEGGRLGTEVKAVAGSGGINRRRRHRHITGRGLAAEVELERRGRRRSGRSGGSGGSGGSRRGVSGRGGGQAECKSGETG